MPKLYNNPDQIIEYAKIPTGDQSNDGVSTKQYSVATNDLLTDLLSEGSSKKSFVQKTEDLLARNDISTYGLLAITQKLCNPDILNIFKAHSYLSSTNIPAPSDPTETKYYDKLLDFKADNKFCEVMSNLLSHEEASEEVLATVRSSDFIQKKFPHIHKLAKTLWFKEHDRIMLNKRIGALSIIESSNKNCDSAQRESIKDKITIPGVVYPHIPKPRATVIKTNGRPPY
ncbi:MAG: hypothetical protein LBM38_06040 [Clostridiales bacterium]|jgi:hypothetical protein|nr:hypothetical protein [Clostridiales bacterium]